MQLLRLFVWYLTPVVSGWWLLCVNMIMSQWAGPVRNVPQRASSSLFIVYFVSYVECLAVRLRCALGCR